MRLKHWLLMSLVACYSASSFSFEQDKLVVWINNDKGHEGLREVAQRFTADTGVQVVVQTQDDYASEDDPANRFTRVATTTEGPDIIFWAHDRIGNWINEGLLEPVQPSLERYNEIHDFAWNAVTVGDSIYGYPIAMETISVIYNKDLVSEVPNTWQGVIDLDKRLRLDGKRAIQWMTDDTYFTWPIITSAGGYSFKKVDRVYQLADVGIDTRGAIKGVQLLNRLFNEGVIEAGDAANWGGMMDNFKSGNTAMMINGPWTWKEISDAGINYGLAKFPQIDNNSGYGRPFVGFLAGYVNRFSPNDELAKQFLEDYVIVYNGVKTINADKSIGAAANKQLQTELNNDPQIALTFSLAATGETMPDLPEMKRFWSSMKTNLQPMIQGEKPVAETMTSVADKLRRLDKMKMWSRKHYLAGPATGAN